MLETINDFGRKVSALYRPNRYCPYAPPEETLGIIDTSGKADGSRGIAFLCDELRTCFSGEIRRAGYRQITSVTIIKSYETTFDDELQIEMGSGVMRISDCSLNKFFLKQLVDSLCRLYKCKTEEELNKLHEEAKAAAMEFYGGELPTIDIVAEPVPVTVPEADEPQPLDEKPVEIPDGKIVWISGKKPLPQTIPDVDELPEDMTRDEAMSYLLDSISEINAESDDIPAERPQELNSEAKYTEAEVDEQLNQLAEEAAKHKAEEEAARNTAPNALPSLGLTEEPEGDDIYLKASKRIRLFCEQRKLTMEQVETAVKDGMVSAAEYYTRTAAEGTLPAVVTARAELLKAASDNLPKYFELGEDIAARVMFFMLYQMLSYADRIAETTDTKERLNNFFCRFPSVAMALSLLDSGI